MDWGALVQNQYMHAAIVLLITIALAKLFQSLLVHYLKKATAKTETDIDDIIVQISARPLFYLIVTSGLYFTVNSLQLVGEYGAIVRNMFFIIAAGVLAWLAARILGFLITRWFVMRRGLSGSPKILNIIVSFVVYIVAIIMILSYFDIEISPLVATLGVGGLAVGLALQDTLSNVFAGIHIISDQPVRVKDYVEVPEKNIRGVVTDIGWRSTRIRTFDNNIVILPNAMLASSVVTNFHMPEHMMKTTVHCGVAYGSDLEFVEDVTLDVATKMQKTIDGALPEFDPIFRFHTFGDSNVDFKVILGAKTRGDTFLLAHEFVKALHARFEKEDIEISWPVRKQFQYKMELPKKQVKKKLVKKKKIKRAKASEDE
ncbi:MAG: mechanosensitive ion channel family protein [Candidatus Woesearchaeota archaeon]|nr:mechanosensitive ion channel family protein [Candidatus Woesearchaeota archaeon]